MIRFLSFSFITVTFFITGCAQPPEGILTPAVRMEMNRDSGKYTLLVSGGIKNSNPSTAFTNVKGVVSIGSKGKAIIAIPFKVALILPYETGIITAKSETDEKTFFSCAEILNVDKNDLEKEKSGDALNIDRTTAFLSELAYEKKDIIKLLKEKSNEKSE